MGSTLQGRIVWVVGASGAIGSVITARLAQEGATVVASSRSAEKLEQLAASLQAVAPVLALPADIGDAAAVQAAVSTIVARHGRIDGLVNCTSVSAFAPFLDLDDATWERVLDSKLMGYVRTMRACLPHMIAAGSGAIVNISGRSGRQPSPAHLPGGCANAAINLLGKGVSDAYRDQGIRVNTVAPGPIRSGRLDSLNAASAHAAPAPAAASGPPVGEPIDVAEAVVWLLSDSARHLNGSLVAVDGGALATV